MSKIVSDLPRQMAESAMPLIYRLAAYFMLTILDDPAMLALAFC
ncbi:MAG: hypothetical protein NTV11_10665 [Rhodocyclales bacterium]|nr:hypothetical protein [Rhodocyclales bacterium]